MRGGWVALGDVGGGWRRWRLRFGASAHLPIGCRGIMASRAGKQGRDYNHIRLRARQDAYQAGEAVIEAVLAGANPLLR